MNLAVRAAVGLALTSGAGWGEGNPYVGAPVCGVCHPKQIAAQSRSAHARALSPAGEHRLVHLAQSSQLLLEGFSYRFERLEGGLKFLVGDSDRVRDLAAEWAFGAGDQAITFVSRLSEDSYVELRASLYSNYGLGLTPGHQAKHPKDLEEALGVRYKTFSPRSEILSCFGCHSTGLPSLGSRLEIVPRELGVRCEACHGPGGKHVELMKANDAVSARKAIVNPALLKTPELIGLCGECHRQPASEGTAIDWADPWNVRHQPVYLTESACYKNTTGGVSCVRCHDPHLPLRRNDPAYYSAKCSACHSAKSNPPAAVCRSEAGCASCHMPGVRPQPELVFHNHWIGVYSVKDPLRPQRR